ncbi:hypothetical protein [uncultured Bacteroides sp.]|uniref:hypothetical protein n=1 Tax=uncultured Bacteroides sp. TaxID=162156 RepID=UPI00280BC99B|nr:hypothetical protein [uncultured Bacteroides sp.]
MKSKVYIIISFICASLCWLSCNDDEKHTGSAPEILFMTESMSIDLNKTNNPSIVCVINSEVGLNSVQSWIVKEGGIEMEIDNPVTSFFNKNSYSLTQTPVYTEDMIGFKVSATDANGQTSALTLPFEVIPLRDAPVVSFNEGINEINYREGDPMPSISVKISSEENLRYVAFSEVVNRLEKIVPINGQDTLKFTNNEKEYVLNLQDDDFQFKVGTTAIKIAAGAGSSDMVKIKIGTLKVNFEEIPAPEILFDSEGDLQVNEFADLTVTGKINSQSQVTSVSYYKETAEGKEQIGETVYPNESSYNFSVTLERVTFDIQAVIIEATDQLGKTTTIKKTLKVKELAPAPSIIIDQTAEQFNGVSIDVPIALTGKITSEAGITSVVITKTTRKGEESTEEINITNDRKVIVDQNYTADIELAGLKLTATDINGKESSISYDIHVGYYYHTVLMSLDGAPKHEDSTPGCFFSASTARAFDYCDGKDNWQEVDIAFSSYSSNTVIRVASLKQSITKFKHTTCGLDKWDNVKGVYFRTASNIKRSTFDKATINDMKAERLATGFTEVASLTEGNFETATEAVGVYETPINGVAKRVIVTYDHFVERTTQNLAASKFMIKVKIEK